MLIIPLHRRMTWSNFPVITFTLIALNVFVFCFLQSGDSRILKQAAQYYVQSHLGRIEFPAYMDWLQSHGRDPDRLAAMQRGTAATKVAVIESDQAFLAALHAGSIVNPTRDDYADWRAKRAEFERIRSQAFTPQHALRYSRIEPGRVMWAMFMHGSIMHLVGNMLFLVMLGLLVEGALGPWWFLGLYLVGGVGAASASLALHWGDAGMMLGASGAIAALMGGYCVLWGLRKVRVFYWLFILFDYVRVPALLLLPVWFGWQLYNLATEKNAHVAFGAHAAGILCGAVIAVVLKRTGQVRQDFIEEDERTETHADDGSAYAQAMEYIGRLEIASARRLLEGIDHDGPYQLRVLVALYRCARYGGTPAQLDAAAARALAFPAGNHAHVQELGKLYDDFLKACSGRPRLDPGILLRLVGRWTRMGEAVAAEAVLRSLSNSAAKPSALAAAWFMLAMRAPEGSPEQRERLNRITQSFADSEYAAKARFLLQET